MGLKRSCSGVREQKELAVGRGRGVHSSGEVVDSLLSISIQTALSSYVALEAGLQTAE